MMQLGGQLAKNMNVTDTFSIFLLSIGVFLLKCYLVQWSYNSIFPILRYNNQPDTVNKPFVELTYTQSIVVVILFNNLFVM